MSDDKMREAFEAWAKQRSLRNSLFGAHEYPHPNCQFAWEVWQAATQARPVDAPTDAERLDFMVRECAWIVWTKRDGSIRQCQLWAQDSDELIHIVSGESRFFNTAREAIDAAMRATPADAGGAR